MSAPPEPRVFWKVWVTTFVTSTLLAVVWMLAQPPYSGADEAAHLTESEALYSGQFFPPLTAGSAQFESGVTRVRVPDNGAACFTNHPFVSARCDQTSRRDRAPLSTELNYVSREPLLSPLLTGLPPYLDPDRTGLYLGRLLNAMAGTVLLATALAMAVTRRRRFLVLGIVLATTPAAMAELGVLGTSGLEIESAVLLWTTVALVLDRVPVTSGVRVAFTVSSVLLLASRPVSFVFFALAAAALAIGGGRSAVLALAGGRGGRVAAAVVAVVGLFSVGWYLLVTAPVNPAYAALHQLGPVPDLSTRLSIPLGSTSAYWKQAIGAVGSNDYTGPWWMTLLWTLLLGVAGGLGLLLANRRRVATVAVLGATLVALPVVAQAVTLARISLYWQGRYDIPLLAGVIILAASAVDGRRGGGRELLRLAPVGVVLAGGAQILGLAGTLRRYVVGVQGSFDPLGWSSGWHPPLPAVVLLGGGAAVVVALYASLRRWVVEPVG